MDKQHRKRDARTSGMSEGENTHRFSQSNTQKSIKLENPGIQWHA